MGLGTGNTSLPLRNILKIKLFIISPASFCLHEFSSNAKMENTRVFVSGLPPTCSNDQLRNHFASRFQVTDAHVLPKRRMGFVGFKSHDAAQEAVKYFNKTFLKMSKISVDIARPVCEACCELEEIFIPVYDFVLLSFLFSSLLPCRPTLTSSVGPETDHFVD